jgi:hypothetical protein
LDFAPPVFDATFDMQPAPGSGDVWVVPVDSLRADQIASPKLQWESLDDHRLLPAK